MVRQAFPSRLAPEFIKALDQEGEKGEDRQLAQPQGVRPKDPLRGGK